MLKKENSCILPLCGNIRWFTKANNKLVAKVSGSTKTILVLPLDGVAVLFEYGYSSRERTQANAIPVAGDMSGVA